MKTPTTARDVVWQPSHDVFVPLERCETNVDSVALAQPAPVLPDDLPDLHLDDEVRSIDRTRLPNVAALRPLHTPIQPFRVFLGLRPQTHPRGADEIQFVGPSDNLPLLPDNDMDEKEVPFRPRLSMRRVAHRWRRTPSR